jgi:hypothetical protein
MSNTAAGPKSRPLAIVAIIFGGGSLPLYWKFFPESMYFVFAFVLGLIGVVLGLVAWLRARKHEAAGRGLALAGLVVSIVSLALIATHLFLFNVLFAAF